MKLIRLCVIMFAAAITANFAVTPLQAQNRYEIAEPKKAKSSRELRAGEGALQLSVRTQEQFTESAIVYFIAVDADGRDTTTVLRFERGAGVPFMGSNMIDEKQQAYRVPAGRYRPIAFTVACDAMPSAPGQECRRGFGASYPTGFYPSGAAVFEVKEGEFTQAGDFIVEYNGEKPPRGQSLLEIKDSARDWQIKWREGSGSSGNFDDLPLNRADVPVAMRSRIECDARPEGVMLYIPFEC